jgi:hypothetical protein
MTNEDNVSLVELCLKALKKHGPFARIYIPPSKAIRPEAFEVPFVGVKAELAIDVLREQLKDYRQDMEKLSLACQPEGMARVAYTTAFVHSSNPDCTGRSASLAIAPWDELTKEEKDAWAVLASYGPGSGFLSTGDVHLAWKTVMERGGWQGGCLRSANHKSHPFCAEFGMLASSERAFFQIFIASIMSMSEAMEGDQ